MKGIHAPDFWRAFAGLAKRSPTVMMRCIDFEQLRLLSANTLDKPKKKRHNHMLDLMSVPQTQRNMAVYIAFIASLLAACAFAVFYIFLVGSYWGYFDMGLAGPNGFVLLHVYAPIAVIFLLCLAVTVWLILRRCRVGPWVTVFLCCVAMTLA